MNDVPILSSEFVDCEVSNATFDEMQLLKAYHVFLSTAYDGYSLKWESDLSNAYIIYDRMGESTDIADLFIMTAEGVANLSELVNESLPNLLIEIAPKGCYFGSHQGSGSLIGYWPIEEEEEN